VWFLTSREFLELFQEQFFAQIHRASFRLPFNGVQAKSGRGCQDPEFVLSIRSRGTELSSSDQSQKLEHGPKLAIWPADASSARGPVFLCPEDRDERQRPAAASLGPVISAADFGCPRIAIRQPHQPAEPEVDSPRAHL